MTWLTWTAFYVVAIVAYYFFSKKLFNEQKNVDPRFYGGLLQVVVGIVGIAPALFEGWYFVWNQTTLLWLVVVSFAYTIGPSLYYTGLKHTHHHAGCSWGRVCARTGHRNFARTS